MVCTQMKQDYMSVEGRGQPCDVLSFQIYTGAEDQTQAIRLVIIYWVILMFYSSRFLGSHFLCCICFSDRDVSIFHGF